MFDIMLQTIFLLFMKILGSKFLLGQVFSIHLIAILDQNFILTLDQSRFDSAVYLSRVYVKNIFVVFIN
ncbi:hypothetical protein DERP_008205 [Dermatophagoides pteronyssinus]|uniref:Uncharacterized protein n=1 Tax=Dermatophagoides pteronyssinus TaxID=6956 RepID=A0ABQ8JK07_DERPT|nr:hypothetical protein DERP_008205 [Dermatophagoides pteronyssinus]